MTTRAKFECHSVTKASGRGWYGYGSPEFVYDSKLQAVTGNSEENKQFFAATPGGEITLRTLREDTFVPGKSYFVDFTEVEQ